MAKAEQFLSCHPWVNFLYFALVLLFSVFLMHPGCLMVSLVTALLYSAMLRGWDALRQSLRWLLPAALLAALINPAFTHKGITVLTYLPSGNPLTLESIVYGLAAAAMLAAVLVWFTCWNRVLTTDKLVCLFGSIAPALSLLLSMTLRFVPRFRDQMRAVLAAQQDLNGHPTREPVLHRIKRGSRALSILVTWSLEHAIETADSMKGRGYGLPGRTAFTIYRLDRRDRILLVWLSVLGGCVALGWITGALSYVYYPALTGSWSLGTAGALLAYLALCLTPCILERRERKLWQSRSKERKP